MKIAAWFVTVVVLAFWIVMGVVAIAGLFARYTPAAEEVRERCAALGGTPVDTMTGIACVKPERVL